MANNDRFASKTKRRNTLFPADRAPHPLCSVWPEQIYLSHRPLCPGVIPGRKQGERYAKVMVPPGQEQDDMGNVAQVVDICISARNMALSIIDLCDGGMDESVDPPMPIQVAKTSPRFEQGLFVPVGKEPTDDEILAAEERMRRFMVSALEAGDVAFAANKNPREVPQESRVSARHLGAKRDWSSPLKPVARVLCPVCRQAEVVEGAMICSPGAGGCGSRIRWEGNNAVWDVPANVVAQVGAQAEPNIMPLPLAAESRKLQYAATTTEQRR